MQRWLRFSAVLVGGLALLTLLAWATVRRSMVEWTETDLERRVRLVTASTSDVLASRLSRNDVEGLERVLEGVGRDERLMAAAVCGASPVPVASTELFAELASCDGVRAQRGERIRGAWFYRMEVGDTRLHVGAVPIDGAGDEHVLVVLHDMAYATQREGDVLTIILAAFVVLALGSVLVTIVAARLSWRSWTEDLRRVLRGGERRREFQPLMRDVRELAQRLATASEGGEGDGRWSAERLKSVLTKHLEGDRVIVVANREPYIHERQPEGIRVVHPASGLVTALEPVLRACSGVWVAHGSGSADRETVDASDKIKVPPGEESYVVRRVWLGEAEERGYYYGFSNEGLWPLCHLAHARPSFRESDWKHYVAVNERFAMAACDEAETDDPIILVQDYHLALVPRMIRKRLPRATILTFWHTPWPNAERFGICPWRHEIIDGLLGSSILGFHTQQHCNNFLEAVDAFVESRIDRERHAVVQGARTTLVRPYPISIEWPVRWLAKVPPAAECRASVLEEIGLPPDGLVGVGIDRLDYTKGIEERLLAVERLLERTPSLVGRFSFVQLAAPSRTQIPRYRDLNELVEETARRINERFGTASYRPIVLLRAHHEPPAVYRYFRAADVCYVSSLHDGMNLVAKEFVAARDDERGVLVLSCFTGAARELTEALVVNPYDLEEASAALGAALEMSKAEQAERMRAMRTVVAELNVYRWAGRMLVDAAALRRKDRLTGRLSTAWAPGRGAPA